MTNHHKFTQRTGLWIFPITAGLLRDAEGIPVLSCLQQHVKSMLHHKWLWSSHWPSDERWWTAWHHQHDSVKIKHRSSRLYMRHDETLWNLWMSFCFVLLSLGPLCIVPKHSNISGLNRFLSHSPLWQLRSSIRICQSCKPRGCRSGNPSSTSLV